MEILIFATHNENKVKEIRSMVGEKWNIVSLDEIGLTKDIPEPFDTLEANARTKSETIFRETGKSCFSEDTGLEVFSLDDEPGVLSARYAGSQRSSEDNMNLLLKKLGEEKKRTAQFRTVISFIYEGEERQFEGICKGEITNDKKGEGGFGYDPIFVPEGAEKTFAQMKMSEKGKYSHRAKAFKKFLSFLEEKKS